MTDRAELMESVLDGYPEAIALLGLDGQVAFWNRAAEAITGFAGMEIVSRPLPVALEPLLREHSPANDSGLSSGSHSDRGATVNVQHKLGYTLRVSARIVVLRDGLGERIGKAVLFHTAEYTDALPRGELSQDSALAAAQEKLEERLEAVFEEFQHTEAPLGLLWISVDQAQDLRKSHGIRACEAMLDRVEQTLANGLRPQDELGRWGDDDFLILAHESQPQALASFGQHIAGLARTTDFRWWGDRISLTVSLGVALAEPEEMLAQLLERARAAMQASVHAGGNHTTLAPGQLQDGCAPETSVSSSCQLQQPTGSSFNRGQASPEQDSTGRQPCLPS